MDAQKLQEMTITEICSIENSRGYYIAKFNGEETLYLDKGFIDMQYSPYCAFDSDIYRKFEEIATLRLRVEELEALLTAALKGRIYKIDPTHTNLHRICSIGWVYSAGDFSSEEKALEHLKSSDIKYFSLEEVRAALPNSNPSPIHPEVGCTYECADGTIVKFKRIEENFQVFRFVTTNHECYNEKGERQSSLIGETAAADKRLVRKVEES